MSTTNRIVLLSSEGDELFSGSSLLVEPAPPTLPAVAPPAPHSQVVEKLEERVVVEAERGSFAEEQNEELEDEPVPETLRSSVFVRAHEPVSRPIVIEMEEDHRAA